MTSTPASRSHPLLQIALLTGQSVPGSCSLSPEQAGFLARLAAEGGGAWSVVDRNFPFDATNAPYRRPSIAAASVANARQYRASRHLSFAMKHRPTLVELIDSAPVTVWLAGSCGLELLHNVALPAASADRCRVLAYGPAARRLPEMQTELVIGRRDWVSPLLFRCPPRVHVHRIDCDHLGYLRDATMFSVALDFVRRAAVKPGVTAPRAA